jgi:L-asparaginase
MRILNTGGTFNKVYDPVRGELVVPQNDAAVVSVLQAMRLKIPVEGLIYKDSLEMNENDRAMLCERITALPDDSVVVVHGTDTMHKSARYVAKRVKNKCVVFTGAMVPFSIDKAEASANLALAIAKATLAKEMGVFIAMHGLAAPYDRIYKDKQKGIFCLK